MAFMTIRIDRAKLRQLILAHGGDPDLLHGDAEETAVSKLIDEMFRRELARVAQWSPANVERRGKRTDWIDDAE